MTFTHALSTNNYGPAKFIVDASAANGTHTTIASALTSAATGDTIFIRPGTYTENLTLKNGVQLSGLAALGGSGDRTVIIGKLIDGGGAVNCTITNLTLQTNSDNLIALTGSGTVTCVNCRIRCENATGINVGAGSTVQLIGCTGQLNTTGIGYWTGAGTVTARNSNFDNSGNSTTASTTSGVIQLNYCTISAPISTSGAGVLLINGSYIDCSTQNTTAITTAGTGTSSLYNSTIFSGTASAVSVGSGTIINSYNTSVSSINTNAITGAGTYKTSGTSYINTSRLNNVTTKTWSELGDSGTFTPALDFGGAAVGLTYANRFGSYVRIGNLVWFTIDIELSAKGSSTGTANITGLPFDLANTAGGSSQIVVFPVSASSLTFSGMVNARIPNAASSTINLDNYASAGARATLTETAFGDATFVQITGCYVSL